MEVINEDALNSEITGEQLWIVDTGCTHHMTRIINSVDYWLNKHKIGIRGAGSKFYAAGLAVVNGLKRVLVVPKMRADGLLSVSQIIDNSGLEALFTKKGVKFGKFSGKVAITGTRDGNLYYMDPRKAAKITQSVQCHQCRCAKGHRCLLQDVMCTNKCILWHRRLGHIPFRKLKEIRDKRTIKGVNFSNEEYSQAIARDCEGCMAGSTRKKPRFSTRSRHIFL